MRIFSLITFVFVVLTSCKSQQNINIEFNKNVTQTCFTDSTINKIRHILSEVKNFKKIDSIILERNRIFESVKCVNLYFIYIPKKIRGYKGFVNIPMIVYNGNVLINLHKSEKETYKDVELIKNLDKLKELFDSNTLEQMKALFIRGIQITPDKAIEYR